MQLEPCRSSLPIGQNEISQDIFHRFDFVILFLISVPSHEVLGFPVFYDVTYNVVDTALVCFGFTLFWVRRISGGIEKHVSYNVCCYWDFRFVSLA